MPKIIHLIVVIIILTLLAIFISPTTLPIQADVSSDSFTIVVIPDTQNMTSRYHGLMLLQNHWIREHIVSDNILFINHVGDIVNNRNALEGTRSSEAYSLLDGYPLSIAPGNHDCDYGADYTWFDTYYPSARYSFYDWYEGNYTSGYRNNYSTFSFGANEFLVISLEWVPDANVFTWANSIVSANPDKRVIVNIHNYLESDGTRSANGENVWNNFVKLHSNIFMVTCGHTLPPTGGDRLVSVGDTGNTVYQLLSNYQDIGDLEGDAWLRLMAFDTSADIISVKTYSPYNDSFLTDGSNQFDLSYNMDPTIYTIPNWWNASWVNKKVISFTTSTISENLASFPVRVELDNLNFDFDLAETDGSDIRFIDKDRVTVLSHQIEWWDYDNESACVWVKIPQIDASSEYTDYFFVYYGNTDAIDQQHKERVWGDYRIISVADFDPEWTGTSIDVSYADKVEGVASVRDYVVAPVIGTEYITIYDDDTSPGWDLSTLGSNISFWFKSNRAGTPYTWSRVYVFDDDDHYRYWDIVNANVWTNYVLDTSTGTVSDPAPDMSAIDRIEFNFKAADETAFSRYYDWLEIREGAVGIWLMNEGEDTTLTDSTRYGNDGTFKGAGEPAWVQDGSEWVLDFDGDDYIVTTIANSLKAQGTISIENRFNADAVAASQTLISTQNAGTSGYYLLAHSTGRIMFGHNGLTNAYTMSNNNAYSALTWYNIIATYDKAKTYIFVDGTENKNQVDTGTITAPTVNLYFGRYGAASQDFYAGLMSHAAIYTKALSAEWVEAGDDNFTRDLLYFGGEDPTPTVTTLAATDVYMNGGTHATLRGELEDLGGAPTCDIWFEWGYDTSYGNVVAFQTVDATGTYTYDLEGYNHERIVHYRFVGNNINGVAYGEDMSFKVTGAIPIIYWLMFIFLPMVVALALAIIAITQFNDWTIAGIIILAGIFTIIMMRILMIVL